MKNALNESFKKKKVRKNDDDSEEEDKNQEDDLAQITGGKEAEVDEYTDKLKEITENQLIQEGLLGRFLPMILGVANEALRRYTDAESVL